MSSPFLTLSSLLFDIALNLSYLNVSSEWKIVFEITLHSNIISKSESLFEALKSYLFIFPLFFLTMEEIKISQNLSKEKKYIELVNQVNLLIKDERDLIANLSNTCSAINEVHNFLWTGFYIVKEDELVLGPFQGPVACTRIGFGRGVCGKSWEEKRSIIVDDVEKFPGHIACSSKSKSEIVIPIFRGDDVFGVLDVDDTRYGTFDEVDEKYLKKIVELIEKKLI